jgi:hypothetical protein
MMSHLTEKMMQKSERLFLKQRKKEFELGIGF